jgi:Kef-type K+ transport system membrane component KefB
MLQDPILFTFFLIFTGAAVIAAVALFARQSLLVAYVLLGVLLGPSVFGIVGNPEVIKQIAHIGIIFLLFLLGLSLNPVELLQMVRKTTLVTISSSLIFALAGFTVSLLFGVHFIEAILVGVVMSFSSTIIGLKLLPTSILHHQRTGEVVISILLLQDLLAMVLLVLVKGAGSHSVDADGEWLELVLLLLKLPLLVLFTSIMTKYLLIPLMRRFDKIREFIFLVAIGWCLGMAQLASWLGLSAEIGAFIGGISLASAPVALFISESLKPLRDFFLILFFFSLGARMDLGMSAPVILPALVLCAVTLLLKPPVFRWLLLRIGETEERSSSIGIRLGQMSEFSLLISVVAMDSGRISLETGYLIQFATLFTFIASSWWVVQRLPTPIATRDELRLD